MKRLLAMFPILLVSLGCGGQGTIPMQGKLIYTTNQGVHEFSLSDRQSRVTLIGTQSTEFESLERLDSPRLFVGSDYGKKIQILDRSSLLLSELHAGYRPTYMPAHRKFFFFQSSKETGPRLYLADLSRPTERAKPIAENAGRFTAEPDVIPVSDDEVVFPIRGDAGKTPPYRYNLVTDKLEQLPFTRQCTPYVWRSVSKQLLCGIDGSSEYYLIDLDGQHSVPLDLSGVPSKSPLPLLYIPKYDVLILGVARTKWVGIHAGEHFDLWAYSFKDGRSEKLLEDNAPGRGGIVWVEQ
jgi:hypothetical protein